MKAERPATPPAPAIGAGEDLETHEKMGFHQGWGLCADQLPKLAQSI